MKSTKFGMSVQNLPIMAYHFGSSGPQVLILGGVHGDETEGVICARSLLAHFSDSFGYNLQLTVVPEFNIDGVLKVQRKNANGVDLNRNLPTKDWTRDVAEERYYPGEAANSEPENQALCQWLETYSPRLIISLHSWKPMLNTNGNCQPEANIISEKTGYEVHESIGYPTPGCLGTFTGLERDMPTITYEIERGMAASEIIKTHVPAILEALKATEKR
ncbi:MAG: M14 family zinc carboxypeptidase [Bdellovibrionales bacterium]